MLTIIHPKAKSLFYLLPWLCSTQMHQGGESGVFINWCIDCRDPLFKFMISPISPRLFSFNSPLLCFSARERVPSISATCSFAVLWWIIFGSGRSSKRAEREENQNKRHKQNLKEIALTFFADQSVPPFLFLVILSRDSYYQTAVWLNSGSWPQERKTNQIKTKQNKTNTRQ